MSFGCLHTQSKGHRDFFCAFAFGQQLYDFALARGQAVAANSDRSGGRTALQVALKHHGGYLGSEVGLITPQSLDGCDKVAGGIGFEQEAAGPGVQDLPNDLI